ncbi:hypothetical protein MTR67_051740 [Solanum verrucosum]|uniref:Reverse transcriptase n=1 Tax=Solanum verrucosum TaxID=315347 RepID=A0AAF1A2Q7_SOLVR|nr:hypothetical protein MTR67_051740 [Solanum verrucosum]
MYPYPFFLSMEYLQRELEEIKLKKDFKYHPRCKKLGVVHICFAHDLLLFCKADLKSIQLLQRAFQRFSKGSSLQANNEKSSIFMSGVKPELKKTILETLAYVEGEVPFKYLGVPVSSKKLTIGQCLPLVEKITERIRCWSAKLLPYVGRIQLIKSVIFVRSRKALVLWEKLCLPKAAGGLNIINLSLWNTVAILNLLWPIHEKKDCLWIRWVHIYYMKDESIENCTIPASAT